MQEFGPFISVQFCRDVFWVRDGFQPIRFAVRTAAGMWVVSGLEGMLFDGIIVKPPKALHEADLDEAQQEFDREYGDGPDD
jgi:hypothetical protein